MPRPRIEGMDERIIDSFISRGVYTSQKEVIHAALSALVREQKKKEALQSYGQEFDETTYANQLKEDNNAPMGHMVRKTAVR